MLSRLNKIHVSSTCFDKKTKTLVIALIDKEVKIYRVKENGSRINLEHRFSFYIKNIATYMEITRYIVNDKLILIVGTDVHKIEIYYIDEKPLIEEAFQKKQKSNMKEYNYRNNKQDKIRDSALMIKTFDMVGKDELFDTTNPVYIVKLQYASRVGLIVCGLNDKLATGHLKWFDPVDFEESWNYKDLIRDDKPDKHRINISCMDYSETNGLLALGGTEGNIIILDSAALKVINSTEAHSSEILSLYFYDEQHQLISIAKNGAIVIWDTHKMEVLQSFKDGSNVCWTVLDRKRGILHTASQYVKQWRAKVDPEIELKVMQVKALAKDFVHESAMRMSDTPKGNLHESLFDKDTVSDPKVSNVLVTSSSSLVYISFLEEQKLIITVDSKNLVRLWDIETGESHSSYNVEIDGQVTAADIDKSNGYIAVGSDMGSVKICNIFSGGVIYNSKSVQSSNAKNSNPHIPKFDSPEVLSQITELKFVKAITDISLVGTCWGGRVMMWTQPNEERNYQIDGIWSIGHRDDVLWVDSDEKYIATGGADGLVSVWSILSGMLIHWFPVPTSEEKKPSTVSNSVVALKLVKKTSNLLYVCHETGDIHCFEASNGNDNKYFAAKAPINSNWDLDKRKEHMLVVGDTGKAILYKINDKNDYWTKLKTFTAHDIMIYDSTYVCSVKASWEYDMFITATINGDFKLWSLNWDHLVDIRQEIWPFSLSKQYFDQSSVSGVSPKKIIKNDSMSEIEEFDYSGVESGSDAKGAQSPTKRVNFSGL